MGAEPGLTAAAASVLLVLSPLVALIFLCACRLRWLTFSHFVGGACLTLYRAEQRVTLTAALFSVPCGYPMGILGPVARHVG
jgi:hypothetical protein